MKRLLRLVALSCLLSGPQLLRGQTLQPVLTGDDQSYDFKTTETVLRGHARVVIGELTIEADEIRYRVAQGLVQASGNVRLESGPRRILADFALYRVADRSFQVNNARLGQFPYYLTAGKIDGTKDDLFLRDANISYGEPGPWTPTLHAGKAELKGRRVLSVWGVDLGVGKTSGLPLPHLSRPIDVPLVEDPEFSFGFGGYLGTFVDFSAFVPISASFRPGADLGLYSDHGVLAGPQARYEFDKGDNTIKGELRTAFIHDTGGRGDDVLGRPIAADRYFFSWTHQERLGEHATITANLNGWSDSEVVRDFRPGVFSTNQEPDSFLEAVYTGPAWSLSVFTRVQLNTFDVMQQRLPEVRFDGLPTELFWGIDHRLQASAVHLVQDDLFSGPTIESNRLDAYYQWSRPIAPTQWLSLRPVAGVRVTDYLDAIGGRNTYTRTLTEVGADAELRFSGNFDYKNEVWGIDGLRHLVTPKLSYRRIGGEAGSAYIPQIDDGVFSTYLEPLGLGDRRDVDALAQENVLRIGLDQTLQTRAKDYGSRDLARLDLALDYNLDRPAGSTSDWSDLHVEAAAFPAPWLDLRVYSRIDPNSGNLNELNPAITIRDADVWSASVAVHYLADDTQQYTAQWRQRLNDRYSAFARVTYDQQNSRFPERIVGVEQTIAHTWQLRYEVAFYEGRQRESNFGFRIGFNLLTY